MIVADTSVLIPWARLADTMIAQACLDFGLPLLTEDSDFSVFCELAGLELVGSQ